MIDGPRPSRGAQGGVQEATGDAHRQSWTSFVGLGGRKVSIEEVCTHLAELQLDLVLGVLARVSAHHATADDFFDVQNQAPYLNYAIADDFPECLPNAAEMYKPGCAPITGSCHTFIHELGLASLTQLALLNCKTDAVTAAVSLLDFGRVCRLLLILNDHLVVPQRIDASPTLIDRNPSSNDGLDAGGRPWQKVHARRLWQANAPNGSLRHGLIAVCQGRRRRFLCVGCGQGESSPDEGCRSRVAR